MSQPVSYQRRGRVGLVLVDNPPVNALSAAVRQGLIDALYQAIADEQAQIVMLAGEGRTYIAGADIREFSKPRQPPELDDVIQRFEASAKPVVSAIHGTALGGGLELALGCDYRVALSHAKVGLPEVKLGLLPGAGGTQRLPRLTGVETALEMITTGRFVPAPQAYDSGILDAVLQAGDIVNAGVEYCEKLVDEGARKRPVRERRDKLDLVRGDTGVFARAREGLKNTVPKLYAPQRCVDAVQAAVELPFEDGLKRERELFMDCMASDQSKALIHAFFAERKVGRVAGVPADTPLREIKQAAVVGAGTMGSGIAMCFANAGLPVTVLEADQAALDRGLERIRLTYAARVEKGRMGQADMDACMERIRGTVSYADFKDADVAVEAAYEEMDVKLEVFAKLDAVCKDGAILASNTSSLDLDRIAATTRRPQDVIGMHFFSPAHVMKLLEVVRGERTTKDVIATVMKLARTLKKVGVVVGVCDGFVGNRMIFQYMREAEALLLEGATPQQVDRVVTEFGMPMGPFTMGDMSGLDVIWRIRQRQRRDLPADHPLPNVLDTVCEQGRYGQKTGAGWYRYEKGSRRPLPDPKVDELIEAAAREQGVARRELSDDEILKRCLYPLINEGAYILEEGIAQRPGDIDVIYFYGYGFPAWRGGPMFYADQTGLAGILDDIRHWHDTLGAWWKPAPLLERLVAEGKTFASLEDIQWT